MKARTIPLRAPLSSDAQQHVFPAGLSNGQCRAASIHRRPAVEVLTMDAAWKAAAEHQSAHRRAAPALSPELQREEDGCRPAGGRSAAASWDVPRRWSSKFAVEPHTRSNSRSKSSRLADCHTRRERANSANSCFFPAPSFASAPAAIPHRPPKLRRVSQGHFAKSAPESPFERRGHSESD